MNQSKTIEQIAREIGVYQVTISRYTEMFGIKIHEYFDGPPNYFTSYQKIKKWMCDFLNDKKTEIVNFHKDYYSDKTAKEIADKIGYLEKEVINILQKWRNLNPYYNGTLVDQSTTFKYLSSYEVKSWFDGKKINVISTTRSEMHQNEQVKIIGYEDIKEHILEQLETILNPCDISDWGLRKPGGILLYGPPGCGKTYWAGWISKFLNYEFYEAPRALFGSMYVDGAMINLKKLLDEVKSKTKLVLFFDEFDSIAGYRNNVSSSSNENSKVVNTLLQEIPKLIEKNILIIAATNFVDHLDPAVIRPGRFDLKLPIFPPTLKERAEILFYELTHKIKQESPLHNILSSNNALNIDYWLECSFAMQLFSSSLVIDTAEIIKKRLKKQCKSLTKNDQLIIRKDFLMECVRMATSSLTKKDVELIAGFYNEVSLLRGKSYEERMKLLLEELNIFYKTESDPPKPIGFRLPNIQ